MITGAHVIAEAREWIATPFQHQTRLKGKAVDCAGLVIGVARNLGLIDPGFDISNYARSPDGFSLIRTADEHMIRISRDFMREGDVIVIRWAKEPQHFGIVADYLHGGMSIIHAYCTPDGKGSVIEQRLAPHLLARFVAAYRLPGVISG